MSKVNVSPGENSEISPACPQSTNASPLLSSWMFPWLSAMIPAPDR